MHLVAVLLTLCFSQSLANHSDSNDTDSDLLKPGAILGSETPMQSPSGPPLVAESWPMLDWVCTALPAAAMLYFCYVQYYRFCTGGVEGKKQLLLVEAAGSEDNVRVFMDIQIGDGEPGHVEMLVFAQYYPKTAENFRALCTGEMGHGKTGKKLHYKGCRFHRIIPGFMCQGGDCTGGQSIYGGHFKDEWTNGYIEHSAEGLVSMANAGRDTQTSQFFITLAPCNHLDGKHVVFGQVLDGMEVVRRMGQARGKTVIIVDCGEVKSKAFQRKVVKDV